MGTRGTRSVKAEALPMSSVNDRVRALCFTSGGSSAWHTKGSFSSTLKNGFQLLTYFGLLTRTHRVVILVGTKTERCANRVL